MSTHRNVFAAAAFLIAATLSPLCAARAPGPDALSVEIVDDRGRVFRQFDVSSGEHATRRAYLEALKGEHYGIRVHNHSPRRIGLVLAVDGRNIISGGRSNLARHEPMYVLGPWQSATYDGWRTSDTRVHRFFFTEADDSYAGAFGDWSAMGVIALAAYAENRPPERDQLRKQAPRSPGAPAGAPSASREEKAGSSSDLAAEPGTGFGGGIHSRVVKVAFEPASRPFSKRFLKYEWPETLARMGFIDGPQPGNRFWPERPDRAWAPGYAPYPPVH